MDEARVAWAQESAVYITETFTDAVSINGAHCRICSFILAATKLASQEPNFAARIGARMEPLRPDVPSLRSMGLQARPRIISFS